MKSEEIEIYLNKEKREKIYSRNKKRKGGKLGMKGK